MAVEKWIGGSGVGFTWTDAFATATLNSIASGNAILSGISITNQTSLDIFADISIHLASAAFVAPNFIGVYLYPLTHGGTAYGDGRFAASAAGPPGSAYYKGSITLVAATQVQDGILTGLILPPGTFSFLLYNQGGVAFAAAGNTCQYRTYNRSVA